jgi:hypothetical protein
MYLDQMASLLPMLSVGQYVKSSVSTWSQAIHNARYCLNHFNQIKTGGDAGEQYQIYRVANIN